MLGFSFPVLSFLVVSIQWLWLSLSCCYSCVLFLQLHPSLARKNLGSGTLTRFRHSILIFGHELTKYCFLRENSKQVKLAISLGSPAKLEIAFFTHVSPEQAWPLVVAPSLSVFQLQVCLDVKVQWREMPKRERDIVACLRPFHLKPRCAISQAFSSLFLERPSSLLPLNGRARYLHCCCHLFSLSIITSDLSLQGGETLGVANPGACTSSSASKTKDDKVV
jgi:hypothetical protein